MMLTDEHHTVNTMIDQGEPFGQIEDYINSLLLRSEQLGALWLLAWAGATDSATRRQVVSETLTSAAQPTPGDPRLCASSNPPTDRRTRRS
jgi:hypothetical protein